MVSSRCPVDFSDVKTQVNPFAAYDELREEHPVYRDPTTGFYVVLDYTLLREVGLNTRQFSSNTGLMQVRTDNVGKRMREIEQEHGVPPDAVLLITDPPAHDFYRSLVKNAFSSTRVKKLESYLEKVVAEIIANVLAKGSVEFVSEVALMVTMNVTADLLGVPRSQVEDIKRWSDATATSADPSTDADVNLRLIRIVCEFQRYITALADDYRAAPNESLLSNLANAEVDGRRLTQNEMVGMMQQIMVAGHETTTNAMAGAMRWLIKTPGLERTLREDSGLLQNFIEEVLRLEAPLQGMFRLALADVQLGGVTIPAGSVVVLRWGAGNRDPHRFDCPAALDIHRTNARQHLTFGHGPHFCIGKELARSEMRILFTQLLRKMSNFRLVDGERSVQREPHYFIYGIKKLHIAFDAIP
jgi:cytochrome P450